MFFPAFAVLAVIPFGEFNGAAIALADVDLGAVFILAVASMGIYALILAGYASRSKYPALSGVRAAAQLISYEIAMVLALLSVGLWAPSFRLSDIVAAQASSAWWVVLQPLTAFIYLVCSFAETNRGPFDMAEAEQELAGGYNVEYGALGFGMFFVGEYANMIVASAVFICLFLGGWTLPFVSYPAGWLGAVLSVLVFCVKLALMLTLFVWVRWSFPRFRYDQVMKLGWTVLLPLALANLIFNAAVGYLRVKGGV
jgi:NADH-quinone oxidoreductase subunit H